MPASDLSAMMPTGAEYFRILPEMILTIAGTLIMFLEAILERRPEEQSSGLCRSSRLVAALVARYRCVRRSRPGVPATC